MEVDIEMLAAGLGADAIVEWAAPPGPGSADREIVTCRMPGGGLLRLFCKFGPLEVHQPPHRFGLAYEAQVYDQLLPAWKDDVPRMHGAFLDDTTQTFGLALDYLDGARPLDQVSDAKAGLTAAARWIGRFHRWSETAAVPALLRRYDTAFYRTWAQLAEHCTRCLHERFPWLPDLCQRCQRRLPAILPLATIIHGEYQADNILVYNGRNVTVDWGTAALAAGEIDLASLTWGWGDERAAACEQQYCLARWPGGAPEDFALRLTAARVFLYLRRFASADSEAAPDAVVGELEQLLPLAERLE